MLPRCVQIIGGRPQLEPGALRHQVTIQRDVESGYDAAGVAATGSTLLTTLAAIEYSGGREARSGSAEATETVPLVALWYQAGILPNMRVVTSDGAVYRIQSIENILRMNLVLVLTCEAAGGGI